MNPAVNTGTVEISLRSDGILYVRVLPGKVQSLEDARQNLEAARKVGGNSLRAVIVDLRSCEPLEPEVRHHYSGDKMGESFGSLGIVIPPNAFGRMMGNIYLRIARPGIPIQLFEDIEKAADWLMSASRPA